MSRVTPPEIFFRLRLTAQPPFKKVKIERLCVAWSQSYTGSQTSHVFLRLYLFTLRCGRVVSLDFGISSLSPSPCLSLYPRKSHGFGAENLGSALSAQPKIWCHTLKKCPRKFILLTVCNLVIYLRVEFDYGIFPSSGSSAHSKPDRLL